MLDGSKPRCDYCDDAADLAVQVDDKPDLAVQVDDKPDLHLCEDCLELLFRKAMTEQADKVTLN